MSLSDLRARCPKGWGELSLGTFQRIFKEWEVDKEAHERDYAKLLTILCGVKIENIRPEHEEAVYQLVRWVNEEPISFPREPLYIDGKTIDVERVEDLSIGQNILVKQTLDKAKYIEECISMVCAIYLQPKIDGGRFDFNRAKEIEKSFQERKLSEFYWLGFFLLNRALKRGQDSQKRWSQTRSNPIGWLKRMFRPLRSQAL